MAFVDRSWICRRLLDRAEMNERNETAHRRVGNILEAELAKARAGAYRKAIQDIHEAPSKMDDTSFVSAKISPPPTKLV